jgi:hypothetical protein
MMLRAVAFAALVALAAGELARRFGAFAPSSRRRRREQEAGTRGQARESGLAASS